jgi:predicted MPP superfamily phosphohydrolase
MGLIIIYLTAHIYYSFFNTKLMIPVIAIVLTIIFFGMLWLRNISITMPFYVFKVIQFGTYFALGVMFYMATLYLLSDILRIFVKFNHRTVGIIVVSLSVVIAFLGYINTRIIRNVEYSVYTNKITQPLKVVLVSDLHIGSSDMTLAKFKRMIQQINSQNADFVILAGDLLDDASVQFQELGYGELFKQIKAKQGVYATIGNHENYRGNVNSVKTKFIYSGLNLLDDSQVAFPKYNLNLVGITDIGRSGNKPKQAKDFNLSEDKFNLIVEHNPSRFGDNHKDNIDLQLSGHTHGGQMIQGYILEQFVYDKAWGKLDVDNSTLITSSGVGSWGPPIRDITYPEIVVINIIPQAKE